jgi:hypothetical protein
MQTILQKVKSIRRPDDPDERVIANMMITETSRFFSELLPNIDLREIAAFFGAVLGTELAGWVEEGHFTAEESTNELVAIVYAACAETIPRALLMLQKLKEQEQQPQAK